MPAISVLLRPPRKDGRRAIQLKYVHKGTRTKFAVKVAVADGCFDHEALKVLPRIPDTRGDVLHPKHKQETTQINNVYDAINEAVARCQLDRLEPTASVVRKMVDNALAGTKSNDKGPKASDYLRELVHRRREATAASTARTYLVTANRLDKHASGTRIGDMDMKWRDRYIDALRNAGLSPVTLWAEAKQLRTLLNDAKRHGIKTQDAQSTRGWMPKKPKTSTYSLTQSELDQLRVIDLPQRLDVVRDLFLFAAATGMRHSELVQLNETAEWDLADGRAQVRFYAPKTSTWKIVPLNSEARRILDKRAGELPRVLTNQKFNEYLKETARAANLTRIVPKGKTGELVELHQSLSAHDARRTFATLAWRQSVPPAVIMGLTGHTTERQLREYINVTDAEAAEDARKHSFFV